MNAIDLEEQGYIEIEHDDINEVTNAKYDISKQTRKFFITQNNPELYGLGTPDAIESVLQDVTYKYSCFCFERGVKNGTPHFHLYVDFGTPRGFKTPHNLFPHANIQAAKGNVIEIRDYIAKAGKHADTEAARLNDRSTFTEIGNIEAETGKATRRNEAVLKELKAGKRAIEIIEDRPELLFKEKQLYELEEKIRYDTLPTYRPVEVIYISGGTGVVKTRMIYEENEASDVCKITSYPRYGEVKFDAYSAHKVVAFEEYRSQISISDMLNYLDNYKIWLPARFADKVSAYEKVYI